MVNKDADLLNFLFLVPPLSADTAAGALAPLDQTEFSTSGLITWDVLIFAVLVLLTAVVPVLAITAGPTAALPHTVFPTEEESNGFTPLSLLRVALAELTTLRLGK